MDQSLKVAEFNATELEQFVKKAETHPLVVHQALPCKKVMYL